MLNTIKAQLHRLAQQARKTPKIAGSLALVGILIISIFVALILPDHNNNLKTPAVSQQPIAQISITKDGFIPATLVVKKGTKIIWTNSDSAMHQVQANPHPTGESLPGLKSEILNNTQTYEYVASSVGSYGYHDRLNPTINGTIETKE